MKINLVFDYGADVINVPYFVGAEIEDYKNRFDKWCYNKNNEDTYDEEEKVFRFDGDTFIRWLNDYELNPPVRAAVMERGVAEYDSSLPTLFF